MLLKSKSSSDDYVIFSNRKGYGRLSDVLEMPSLISIQINSFKQFQDVGLKELFADISPVKDFNESKLELSFSDPVFKQPKHSEDQCRERDITFSAPLFVNVKLVIKSTGEIKEQELYLGDIPLMTSNGTFVINGAERVVVSQLIRSPGVYMLKGEDPASGRMLCGAKLIPDRGAWLEFETSNKNVIFVKVDGKRKIPVTTLLKARGLGKDEKIIEKFADVDNDPLHQYIKSTIDWETMVEEVEPEAGGLENKDEALKAIYRRLRPGDPPSSENARLLIDNLLFSPKRYDLGKVGRYKLNKRLNPGVPETTRVLTSEDLIALIRRIIMVNNGKDTPDDIDHLGNRRVRTVGELIQNHFRIGLLRLERTIKERMSIIDPQIATPASLINIRPIVASMWDFFSSSQLSQFMDQTNPLSELTHKRRLSALGPGGLSRERAGFEVRDVHHSHYGRICPIETPEGPNVGLIGSLATYGRINEYGFIETPYRKVLNKVNNTPDWTEGRTLREPVENKKSGINLPAGTLITTQLSKKLSGLSLKTIGVLPFVSDNIEYLTADREEEYTIAQANAIIDEKGQFREDKVEARHGNRYFKVTPDTLNFMDVSPKQIVSVTTAMIPFLEHDDANRALMGSNMQRQAVPLLKPEAPIVATGMERLAARDSGQVIIASEDGIVSSITGNVIVVIRINPLEEMKDTLDKAYTACQKKDWETAKDLLNEALQFFNNSSMLESGNANQSPYQIPEIENEFKDILSLINSEAGLREIKEHIGKINNIVQEATKVRGVVKEDAYQPIRIRRYWYYTGEATVKEVTNNLNQVKTAYNAGNRDDLNTAQKFAHKAFQEFKKSAEIDTSDNSDNDILQQLSSNLESNLKEIINIIEKRQISFNLTKLNECISNFNEIVQKYFDILAECHRYPVMKFRRTNQSTSINQRPIVQAGDIVKAGQILADSSSTDKGELALGQNILCAFMCWEGYNFEDAIIISEELVRDDKFTSVHIEKYELEAQVTKLGLEEITRDIPNVGEEGLRNLDEDGIVRIGAEVKPGDILVGKITPKGETELTAEAKLLRAIFGEKAREVRDTSLRVPHGEQGTVIDVKIFSKDRHEELPAGINQLVKVWVAKKRKISVGDKMAGRHGNKGVIGRILPVEDMPFLPDGRPVQIILNPIGVPSRMNLGQVFEANLGLAADILGQKVLSPVFDGATDKDIEEALAKAWLVQTALASGLGSPKRDGITPELMEDVKAWLADQGYDPDKVFGEDNTGEATKTCLRLWLKLQQGKRTDKLSDEEVMELVEKLDQDNEISPPIWGKTVLYDGLTGERFDKPITVGNIYMLKLIHLVEDKIHARSTGSYSLITQQPLGGKSQFGGQRFGEMEVWSLEAYGAAHILQEMLTVKSDDMEGRAKAYQSIVKGEDITQPGIPESFNVLVKEMQSLGLSIEVLNEDDDQIPVLKNELAEEN